MRVNIDGADTAHIGLHTSGLLIFYAQRIRSTNRRSKFEIRSRRANSLSASTASNSIVESLNDQQVRPEPCEAPVLLERLVLPAPRKASPSVLPEDVPQQSPVELGRTSSCPRHYRLSA